MAQAIWNAGLRLLSFEIYGEESRVLPELAVLVRASWELFSPCRLDARSYGLQIVEHAHALGHDLGDHASTLAPDQVYASSQAPTVPESAQRSYEPS